MTTGTVRTLLTSSGRKSGRSWKIAIAIAVPIGILVAWWFLSANSTNPYFPPLQQILIRFQQLWLFDRFASDILPSLGNLLAGFGLAVFIGIAGGVVLGLLTRLAWAVEPVIYFWRAIPPVAFVPIFVSLLGFGPETRIFVITIGATFPTLIATLDGIRSIDPLTRDVARAYRLTWSERIFRVYLPAAGPRMLSGVQVSLAASFILMIASEMLGSSVGIGSLTLLAQQTFASADMWAGILLLGIIGFAASALFSWGRRYLLAWYLASQRTGDST